MYEIKVLELIHKVFPVGVVLESSWRGTADRLGVILDSRSGPGIVDRRRRRGRRRRDRRRRHLRRRHCRRRMYRQ